MMACHKCLLALKAHVSEIKPLVDKCLIYNFNQGHFQLDVISLGQVLCRSTEGLSVNLFGCL